MIRVLFPRLHGLYLPPPPPTQEIKFLPGVFFMIFLINDYDNDFFFFIFESPLSGDFHILLKLNRERFHETINGYYSWHLTMKAAAALTFGNSTQELSLEPQLICKRQIYLIIN